MMKQTRTYETVSGDAGGAIVTAKYGTIGERTAAAWELEAARDEWAERAHEARMACARARFAGKLRKADALHNDAVSFLESARRYHQKAQDVRQTAIRSTT